MEKQEFLVLQAKRYDFKDKHTGNQLKGCNVQFIDFREQKEDVDMTGFVIAKQNLPYEAFEMFDNGIGIYEVTFRTQLQGKGMQLIPDRFKFIRPIVFEHLITK